jgi:peptidyl-prolyl isomerase D
VPEGHEGAGHQYSFKGRPFYRIIHGFIDQAGAETDSVFGGQFKDDPGGLRLKHDRKVTLRFAAAVVAADVLHLVFAMP